jgi:hypothetical protein
MDYVSIGRKRLGVVMRPLHGPSNAGTCLIENKHLLQDGDHTSGCDRVGCGRPGSSRNVEKWWRPVRSDARKLKSENGIVG